MSEQTRADCFKALACLYIAVDKTVADDVNAKVRAYISELETQLDGWRKAASPVTHNPQEDAFYEKAEALTKQP